jgi:hypothetical protein
MSEVRGPRLRPVVKAGTGTRQLGDAAAIAPAALYPGTPERTPKCSCGYPLIRSDKVCPRPGCGAVVPWLKEQAA